MNERMDSGFDEKLKMAGFWMKEVVGKKEENENEIRTK